MVYRCTSCNVDTIAICASLNMDGSNVSNPAPVQATGEYSYSQIGGFFGLHFATVGRIVRKGDGGPGRGERISRVTMWRKALRFSARRMPWCEEHRKAVYGKTVCTVCSGRAGSRDNGRTIAGPPDERGGYS